MTYAQVGPDDGGKNLGAMATYDGGHDSGKTAMVVVSDNMVTAGDPSIVRCDANGNGEIDQSEVITAIDDHLFGEVDIISKDDGIGLVNLYPYPGG